MQVVDWIAIGIIALSLILGAILGFGKTLKIFTGGIVGIIISVVVTYFTIGVVASWGFVQDIMGRFITVLNDNGSGFCQFLINIHIEKIVLAIVLFIVVQILRIIIVKVIKGVAESDNRVISFFNKLLGAIFLLCINVMLALIVFHIIQLIGGDTAESFRTYLTGTLRLEWVYDNNPLQYIIKAVTPAE